MAELVVLAWLAGMGAATAVGLSRAWRKAGRGRLLRPSPARLFYAALAVPAVARQSPSPGRPTTS